MSWLLYLRDFNVQWTIVTALSLFAWCVFTVKPKFGWAAASLLLYTGLSAIWVWVVSDNRYLTMDNHTGQALKYSAADSFGKLVLLLLPMMIFSKRDVAMRMGGELACYCFVFLNSIWIAFSLIEGCHSFVNSCGGMIGNPSIGVSLMVCALPVFIHSWRKQWLILSMAALSVVASKSSVAMGLFAVYGTLWLVPWKSIEDGVYGLAWKAAAFAGGMLGVARLALGDNLTSDSDRFHIWKFMMERWAAPWNIIGGTGLGSYHVFSINLQSYAATTYPDLHIDTNYWWNSMHNEPLEFLFVGGVAGIFLFMATYFTALVRAIKADIRIAIGIILFGLYMTMNPALHQPLPALFGAWLFVYALRIKDTHSPIGD